MDSKAVAGANPSPPLNQKRAELQQVQDDIKHKTQALSSIQQTVGSLQGEITVLQTKIAPSALQRQLNDAKTAINQKVVGAEAVLAKDKIAQIKDAINKVQADLNAKKADSTKAENDYNAAAQDATDADACAGSITLPWTAPSFAAVKGIINAPCTEPAMKPESWDALLAANAKARGWIDDIRLGCIGSVAGTGSLAVCIGPRPHAWCWTRLARN